MGREHEASTAGGPGMNSRPYYVWSMVKWRDYPSVAKMYAHWLMGRLGCFFFMHIWGEGGCIVCGKKDNA